MKHLVRNILAVAALVAGVGIATQASASVVYFEDFETLVDGIPPGWSFSGGVDTAYNTGYDFCCGGVGDTGTGHVLQFGAGESTGGVASTNVALSSENYNLSFQYGAFGGGGPPPQSVEVLVNGNAIATITTAGNTNNLSDLLNTYHLTFVGAAGLNSLTFADVSATTGSTDGVLDNVTVSTVPEPATWAMMLIGFAGVGFAGMRARRKTALA